MRVRGGLVTAPVQDKGREALERLLAKAQPQGPCFLCGPRNHARHRLWDAIDCSLRVDRLSAGQAAEEYGVTVREVEDVRLAFSYARRRKRSLPGRSKLSEVR
jgi:hypothetical protein